MKALARQFSSTFLGWRRENGDRQILELMPDPIYRYEAEGAEVIDGAVFAFTQGTDPESLLLIECWQRGSALEWRYAFARRTSGELNGNHQEIEVWHADPYPNEGDPRSTHFAIARPLAAGGSVKPSK